jgi:hypothetical protein
LGVTALTPPKREDGAGFASHLALLVPTRWGVWTAALQGVFVPFDVMPLGNTVLLRGGFARDVTDDLYVGASLYGGGNFRNHTSAAFALDVGLWYRLGSLGILKNPRLGVAVQNMGITFRRDVPGIENGSSSRFPGPFTTKVGFAALFLDVRDWQGGFSADLCLPTFQNALIDLETQVQYKRFALSLGWGVNVRQEKAGYHALAPSVGLSYRWTARTSGIEFLRGQGWQQSDVTVSSAWKPLFENIQAISGGITVNFGDRDIDAPVITIGEAQ